MALVFVAGGASLALANLLTLFGGSNRIGLFQNDWEPSFTDDISRVVPCTFSGYGGLHDLIGWSSGVLIGDQLVSNATPRLWDHNGGPVSNWVFGYYVVTPLNVLVWAERDPRAPLPMGKLGDSYGFQPQFAMGSKFDGSF